MCELSGFLYCFLLISTLINSIFGVLGTWKLENGSGFGSHVMNGNEQTYSLEDQQMQLFAPFIPMSEQ